jgi:hypothetical protein
MKDHFKQLSDSNSFDTNLQCNNLSNDFVNINNLFITDCHGHTFMRSMYFDIMVRLK